LEKICGIVDTDEGLFEFVKYIVSKGADVNIGIPLHYAISCHGNGFDNFHINENIAIFLIEKGIDVNKQDERGDTPLMNLFYDFYDDYDDYEHIELMKLLIKHGAYINHQNKLNKTALMRYAFCGYKNCIKLLLDHGANVNLKDNQGETALMQLNNIETNYEEIIDMLLEYGADINAKNNMGMTALMIYAQKGLNNLVQIFLDRGADVTVKSEVTAYNIASDDEIKKLISDTVNHTPQKLVKLLSNFSVDKPIKYTTHSWDFGELKKEYGDFDGYMEKVKEQFNSMEVELKDLSENLHKKIYTFLLDPNPSEEYSWCSQAHINIGWSSLKGLKEHCDSGKNAFDFKLYKPIKIQNNKILRKFEDIINLFKQEIEMRTEFKSLENIFIKIGKILNGDFDLTATKLEKQFYTDTQNFTNGLDQIFEEIKKRTEFKNITVTTKERPLHSNTLLKNHSEAGV
jgi:ankyrin repeat protein